VTGSPEERGAENVQLMPISPEEDPVGGEQGDGIAQQEDD
jgi:hypothetical protein